MYPPLSAYRRETEFTVHLNLSNLPERADLQMHPFVSGLCLTLDSQHSQGPSPPPKQTIKSRMNTHIYHLHLNARHAPNRHTVAIMDALAGLNGCLLCRIKSFFNGLRI